MRHSARCLVAILGLSLWMSVHADPAYDLVVRGGTVVDGTGKPGYAADVAIRDGKIVAVGTVRRDGAEKTIDATGLIVAPGFIDVHNHVPDTALRAPAGPILNEAYVAQGVTTVIGGPDGEFAPARIRQIMERYRNGGVATNYAVYVGHNGVRAEVMGTAQRAPTPVELEKMTKLVTEGMQMGAVGLSSGLMYEPGMFGTTDELIALAKAVKPFDGLYDTHTRDPVTRFLESDEEALQIGRAAGIRVKIAHEKAVGLLNKGKISNVIAMVEKERAAGRDVVTDQYPYDGATVLALEDLIVLPGSPFGEGDVAALAAHRQEVKRALRDKRLHAAIREATEHGIDGGYSTIKAVGYGSLRIVDCPESRDLEGENIQLAAQRVGRPPFDVITGLISKATQPVLVTIGSVDEADLRALLVQSWNMIASDGGYVLPGDAMPDHPRSTGTFTRVLGHYVRDLKLLTLAEAIRKMTSLPADFSHIYDRGRIAVGQAADLAVFDPKTVSDKSTWVDPSALSIGMVAVIVNGTPVLQAGTRTGAAPGRFIPRQHR
jgi:N-acyl-D-amino-acid deacylase